MINPTDISIARFSLQNKKLESLSSNNIQKNSRDEELKKAATEFEAVFIKQMLDVMDSTVQKSEFMRGGQAEDTFKSLLNDQMALEIAKNPTNSFGLAEQIYKQMKDRI